MVYATTHLAYSQTAVPPNVRASITFDRLTSRNGFQTSGDVLYGIPVPPGSLIGDTYLDSSWCNANVVLYEKERALKNLSVRLDLYTNGLEVEIKEMIRLLPCEKVKAFALEGSSTTPRIFLNTKEFNSNLIGFFEVLSDGKTPLLKRTGITIKKSNYNAALNIGSHDAKILKHTTYYYAVDKEVKELPKSRKKINEILKELGILTQAENDVDSKNEQTLILLFEKFNRQ